MRPRFIDASGVLLGSMLVALLVAGCGLPSSYYLTPPATPPTLASPIGYPVFQVISTTDNSESEFRGFELYYKCYRITETLESGFGENSLESDLRAKGFLPVCSELDSTPTGRRVPLILVDPLDRGLDFTVTVDFNLPGSATYARYQYTGPVTLSSVSVEVRRYISDGAGACKTFDATEFLATDLDISRIFAGALTDGSFYLAMYALSYGLQDISTPIWSWPVYLGYVEIRF
jgi:hypothetical protein